MGVLEQIEKDTGVKWTQMLIAPASSSQLATAIYEAACKHAGVKAKKLTPRMLLEDNIFEDVPDSLPDSYEDGNPKAEDVTLTDG